MSFLTSAFGLIVVLGVLIFVHELGHFLAARSVGIAVLRFSFGLGPKTRIARRIGETEYCLSWVPFGGYVKMAGAEDDESAGLEGGADAEALKAIPPERMFDHKPLLARIFVISAGVLMNALFALLVYAGLAWHYGVPQAIPPIVDSVAARTLPLGATGLASLRSGDRIVQVNDRAIANWDDLADALGTLDQVPLRVLVAGRPDTIFVDVPLSDMAGRQAVLEALAPGHEPVLGSIIRGDSAERAGLRSGDRVLRAGGDTVPTWEQFVRVVESHPGRPLEVVVARGASRDSVVVTPRIELHEPGATRPVGKIGVGVLAPVHQVGPLGALREGGAETVDMAGKVLWTIKGLVLGRISARDIGGPILIGQMSGIYVRLGLAAFLSFMAFFSVNLAVLNLLPIPVLDGGHLVFLVIEGIRRKPLSLETRQRWMTVGLVVVLLLMVLAVYNDVMRVIR